MKNKLMLYIALVFAIVLQTPNLNGQTCAPVINCPPDISIYCSEVLGSAPTVIQTGTPSNLISNTCALPLPINNFYTVDTFDTRDSCKSIINQPLNFPINVATFQSSLAGTNTMRIIVRKLVIFNNYGKDSCYQVIYIKKYTLNDLICPKDTMISCMNSNTNPSNLGIPKFIDGKPITSSCSMQLMGPLDTIIPFCPGSFKINRNWMIMDCNGTMMRKTQQIIVKDTFAPFVGGAVLDYQSNGGSYTASNIIFNFDNNTTPLLITPLQNSKNCGASALVTIVGIDPSCSNGQIFINSLNTLAVKINTTYFPITKETKVTFNCNFPTTGLFDVEFEAYDSCNYKKISKKLRFNVLDNILPTVVCDQTTKVSLTNDGFGTVNAFVFDDGSKDNCSGISDYKVRRVTKCDAGNQVVNTDNNFYDTIEFSCCDIGTPIMVALQVKDNAGNTNQCMVTAIVEDKVRPTCIPPSNKIIACNDPTLNFSNLSNFGDASVSDNCASETIYNEVRNINNCKIGIIARTWTVKEKGGFKYEASCTQYISITGFSDFIVDFPSDTIVTCFDALNVGIANKLDLLNRPSNVDGNVQNLGCGTLAVNISDEIFTTVPGSCYKIMRKYTVIDWCKFESNPANLAVPYQNSCSGNMSTSVSDLSKRVFRQSDNGSTPNDGILCYTQTITVNDNQAPLFTRKGKDTIVKDYSAEVECNGDILSCDGIYADSAKATDQCGNVRLTGSLNYKWKVFYKNSMVLYKSGVGNVLNEERKNSGNDCSTILRNGLELPYDVPFIVKWEVEDKCGNIGYLEDTIKVVDAKKPSIVGRNVTAELMKVDINGVLIGRVVVWASELHVSSSDNCSPTNALKYGIRIKGTGVGFPRDVNGLPITSLTFSCADLGTKLIELWAEDLVGNSDYCIDTVSIQNNMNIGVGGCPLAASTLINGTIANEYAEKVQDVQVVALAGTIPMGSFNTSANGLYSINAFQGSNYKIMASKSDDLLNGVTTKDILDINKHILGVEVLNSPYKLIAADVNNSGTITSLDMLEIRKAILRKSSAFTNNKSWRFINKAFVFPNPKDPFSSPIQELISFNTSALGNTDFIGVKVADVNGSATPNTLQNNSFVRNETVEQVFVGKTVNSSDIEYKISFENLNFNAFQFALDFENDKIYAVNAEGLEGFGAQNYNLMDNKLLLSWNGKINKENPQLKITISSKNTLHNLDNTILNSQVYYSNETKNIELKYKDNYSEKQYELYQNNPNPFTNSTLIGFSLPYTMNATIQIMDNTGKVVKSFTNEYSKGLNTVKVDKDEIGPSGIYYYQLKTNEFTANKKMVLIK
jgi:Dockerin type I domain